MNNSDLPIGFSFALAMNENAMRFFTNLDKDSKQEFINYIKSSSTGEEAKERISKAVNNLENNNLNFLLI